MGGNHPNFEFMEFDDENADILTSGDDTSRKKSGNTDTHPKKLSPI